MRLGIVSEVDLAVARCRVVSGDLQTDFLPWFVPRAGDTIEWSAPAVGEQVMVLSPGGDLRSGVVMRGMYSDQFPAPSSAGGTHVTRYPDGAQISYDHEAHALVATLPGEATAEITAQGGVTINGSLTVNGDVTIEGDAAINGTATATTDVIGGGKSLKSHRHPGVQSGGSLTAPPQ